MTYEQIIDKIAEVKAEMFRLNSRQEEATNIFDAFIHLVEHDTKENNLAQCLELSLTLNDGKKPTKKTSKMALEGMLTQYKREALGSTEINVQFNELADRLLALRNALKDATVTLPLSTEDMLQAGAMQSDIYDPLEVCKPEVQEVPQETPAQRAKRRIKESAILRQALAMVKELDNSQRTTCIVYAREHNMSSNLAELTDEEAQAWIDFIHTMLHMEALGRETAVRERVLSMAIANYNKATQPIPPPPTKKPATAKKVGNAVHVTSDDKIVSIKTRQPVQPVEPIPAVEKKPAKQPVEKPVKEVKKPVEKSAPSSLVTPEQEAACLIWLAGEYPGMSIPQGFRVRKEKESGLYRVDHWNGTEWHTYINKSGKIGYTRFASELKQWFDKWMIQLGIAA